MKKKAKASTKEEKVKYWQVKLAEYQEKYDQLKKESPGRWWHDEHFDMQLRVWESLIVTAQEKIKELKEEIKKASE
jgi:hypothetical protein